MWGVVVMLHAVRCRRDDFKEFCFQRKLNFFDRRADLCYIRTNLLDSENFVILLDAHWCNFNTKIWAYANNNTKTNAPVKIALSFRNIGKFYRWSSQSRLRKTKKMFIRKVLRTKF